MEKKFILSVVMPVCNTEKYLEETIQCIINQTLDFKKNIQLILVDDCSKDGSGAICRKYKALYPENVIYTYFAENRGASAARNAGMKFAEGRYINFFDSDDLWSLNAYQRAVAYLDNHKDEIDLVSADVESFDAYYNQHVLNQNCICDTIVDLKAHYSCIRSNGPTCIMKREIAEQYRFNEQLTSWEDTLFVNQVILRRQKYGILSSDIKYYYRRRREISSASQQYGLSKGYYLNELGMLFEGIYQESYQKYGCFVAMAQYLIAYALGYRFLDTAKILTIREKKDYDTIFSNVICQIEDKYLLEVCNVDELTRKAMAAYKYGIDMRDGLMQFQELRGQNEWMQQYLEKTKINYGVLKKWFCIQRQKKSFVNYFKSNDFNSIAVYGMTELGQFMVSELKDSPISVMYAIDRRAGELQAEVPILTLEDELPPVDAVVVTAVFYYEQIAAELQNRIESAVVSLEDILYSI